MLLARTTHVDIEGHPIRCIVLFNVYEGNLDVWNKYTWDEPPIYPEIEIVDVFEAEYTNKISLMDVLLEEEIVALEDKLLCLLEDEKLTNY